MTDKLRELIGRVSVIANLLNQEPGWGGAAVHVREAATALQSYVARVEELEEALKASRPFVNHLRSVSGDSAADAVWAKIDAALVKQLSGLDANHDPTHQ